MQQHSEEYIDIVLVEGGEEVERVTIRGDQGFTSLTPLASLRLIIQQELGVGEQEQVLVVDDRELIDPTPEATLRDCGIEHASTVFVEAAIASQHNSSAVGEQLPTTLQGSRCAATLERLLTDLEPSRIEMRLLELEKQWKTISYAAGD